MDALLEGKRIVVGVGGGIAAYKSAALVSRLRQQGARVHVILTRAGAQFVTPLTFAALSHQPVLQDLFADAPLDHVRLAYESDLFVVAPATYDLIGKLASGLADDYLTTTLAATRRPVLLCPAMETQMFENPILQENLRKLEGLGYRLLPPEAGALASGRSGAGRLPEPERILREIQALLASQGVLAGKRVLVTAGPTRERLDPMRVITNRSSGKMGYAVAQAAAELGAQVTLISGPTGLPGPAAIEVVAVESAAQMEEAVRIRAPEAHWVIMAAAVADWRPKHPSARKQGKAGKRALTLELAPTPDILKGLGQRRRRGQVLVGFAAETHDVLERASQKLKEKKADFFIANDVSKAVESDDNAAVLIARDGKQWRFSRQPKRELARQLLTTMASHLKRK
ncbi:MAG TPA: bifunctional phosphopantothenoylcysteine decarboxylase/phosphopantothenate--cysteine ligase CoaBC [Candidatus Bipolaricaulota bacterium]